MNGSLWYDMMVRTFQYTPDSEGRARQREMMVEQAAAVLLVTVVIPISHYWNSVSGRRIILGSMGSWSR